MKSQYYNSLDYPQYCSPVSYTYLLAFFDNKFFYYFGQIYHQLTYKNYPLIQTPKAALLFQRKPIDT